jgi:hypothetical protein
LAKTLGKIVVIEEARHKIRQNAGLPLGIDLGILAEFAVRKSAALSRL